MTVQSLVLRHGRIERQLCFAAADAAPSEEFLSEHEEEQLAGFQFAAKKQGFLLGRLAAKRALGALLEEPDLRRIEIGSGVYGQPLVRHAQAGGVEVTISHSHGMAVAVAFPAAYPIGIDLETVSAISAGTILAELSASVPERAWLGSAAVDEATACCVLWTAREALGKALRIGLNCPLGVLALSEVRAVGGEAWIGRYANFPQCQCLSQARGDRVLSLVMPGEAKLSTWPHLER
jgi:phosphopantetheinyl transferase